MPITRTFTVTELKALDLPPDDPSQPEYFPAHILADEHVCVLKYTQQRRVVFEADDGFTWAVEYEAPLDMGDFEVGDDRPDDHGWWGATVKATRVEQRAVTVWHWAPVDDEEN